MRPDGGSVSRRKARAWMATLPKAAKTPFVDIWEGLDSYHFWTNHIERNGVSLPPAASRWENRPPGYHVHAMEGNRVLIRSTRGGPLFSFTLQDLLQDAAPASAPMTHVL